MSAKSKLKFMLLAATAATIILSPGLIFNRDGVESVYANDLTSPRHDGLGVLLGNEPAAGQSLQKVASINDAFLPQQAAAPLAAAPAAEATRPAAPQFPAAAAGPVQSASLGAPAASRAPVPSVPEASRPKEVVNPFGQPASAAASVAETAAPEAPKVDDTALRYYAANKDLKRLGAEMRRLKQLYPDWQPPKDLFSTGPQISEQPLWDVYKTGNFAAVRTQIAQIQSANPKWQPSDDLLLKLRMGESRAMLNRAHAQGNWQEVLATAQNEPSLLVCEEMQVLWNVGEASARLGNFAEAFELYRYILSSCSDRNLRLSTVQKASLLLPQAGTDALVALGRVLPDGSTEFENIGFDTLRRQIGEFIEGGSFRNAPTHEEVGRFVEFVNRKQSAEDASLIGWYFYAQDDWKNANGWFLAAARYGKAAGSIDGVILTLRKMGETEDALKIARRYMNEAPTIAKQYVELVSEKLTDETGRFELSKADRAEFEQVVAGQKLALGAQALGWKYLGEGNGKVASKWFADSVAWEPTEGGVVGLAVIAARAKDNRGLQQIKSKYGQEFAALSDFRIYARQPSRPAAVKSQKTERAPTEAEKRRQRVMQEQNKAQYKG